MTKFLKNDLGFSLIQGMIIAGVLAGSSLVATRMITDQKLSQAGAETRGSVEVLHELIYNNLQHKTHCTATVNHPTNNIAPSLGAAGGSPGLNTIITRTVIPIAGGGTNFVDNILARVHAGNVNNAYINGSVIIKSMNIIFTAPASGRATLRIVYERANSGNVTKRLRQGYGGRDITKDITLRIQRNPNFVSCYALSEAKTLSSELGNDLSQEFCAAFPYFVWNESLSSCLPKTHTCPEGDVFIGVDANGNGQCRAAINWLDFSEVVDPTPPASCNVGQSVSLQVYSQGPGTHNRVRVRCL